MCDSPTHIHFHAHDEAPGGVIAAFGFGIFLLVKAAYMVVKWVVIPAAAIVAIGGWRWLTGDHLIDRTRRGPDVFTRRVRATFRTLLTAVVAGILAAPLATAITVTTVVTIAAGTVIAVRGRRRTPLRPRRVVVRVGTPWRAPSMRHTHPGGSPLALTDHRSDQTWTEQVIRDSGRAV